MKARNLQTLTLFMLTVAGATGGCAGTESTEPTPTPSAVALLSGNNQTGPVAQSLPQPLVVKVTTSAGAGVAGVAVAWAVTAGGGSVSAASVMTDAQGQASVTWTLGTTAGINSNTATASASGLTGSPVSFTASATAGAPAQLALGSGNNQTGTVGQRLALPLVVVVRDQYGNPTNGVTVAWAVTAGGGSVSAASVTTDAQGRASVTWTLGTTAGINSNTATASASGLTGSPVTFTASVTAASASQLTLVSGNNQTGIVGQALSQPLLVVVRDPFSNPVSGVAVAWAVKAGGGSVSAASVTTDAQGRASLTWTLGTTAGTNNNTATAGASGLTGSPVTFTASATAASASQLTLVSGNNQTGTVGQALSQPLVVVVRDQFNNPVSGVAVAWAVMVGGGSVSAAAVTTDAQGQASVAWTVGTVAGANNNTVQASAPRLSGSPVAFTASATAGPVASVSVSPATAHIPLGGSIQLTATLVDGYGNVVTGRPVVWSSINNPTVTVSATGLVTAGMTMSLATITATAEGKAGSALITVAVLSGHGTATIDGTLSTGEWDGAVHFDFAANLPGGGTTPATLFIMNNATNLYLAVRFARTVVDPGNSLDFEFDNNDNGVRENGDDVLVFTVGLGFFDEFRTTQPPCSSGALCAFLDTDFGGTNDGAGAFRNDGTFSVYEMSHSLSSGDVLHDFSLSAGQPVGVQVFLRIIGAGNVIADTTFPVSDFLHIIIS